MTKYHISPTTGNPNKCSASKKPCPIGGEKEHYLSREEAQKAYESKQQSIPVGQVKAKPQTLSPADRKELYLSKYGRNTNEMTPEDQAEVDEFIDKIYDENNRIAYKDLTDVGDALSGGAMRGSYEIVGFKIDHQGETLYGVIYDDGNDSGLDNFFDYQMDFATDEREVEALVQQGTIDFVENHRY